MGFFVKIYKWLLPLIIMKEEINSKNKNNKDFWILESVGWITVLLGLLVNPSAQTPNEKFFMGILSGIGIACLIISFMILLRSNKKNGQKSN